MTSPVPRPLTVLVQVVPVEGREISFGSSLTEQLEDRIDDVRGAIATGIKVIAESLNDIRCSERWKMGDVSASFSVTLTAEAGVIVSKASAGATFEIQVTFQPDDREDHGSRTDPSEPTA